MKVLLFVWLQCLFKSGKASAEVRRRGACFRSSASILYAIAVLSANSRGDRQI
jgi:hypothetical protein